MINLSQDFSIDANLYANQGNSDIGIRGSGKTHTATKAAEDLMTDGIPIVVFDPSGVWHNLRYGKDNKPGFPIVVAGGLTPDLELTELNAIKILEAAIKENVSIIFDLSEVESKAKEIKIVGDCIEYIMQFNKTLRHIFIEEAAEYCPQKLHPGLFKVYSQLERMARIGRNKGLGFTLINQRSQEIAKAIFELCDRVFVHRQTGMNSLNVIDSWFKYKGIEDKNDIVKTLPKLVPGECWVVDINGEHRIKVLPKKTFHPDPQNNLMVAPEKSKKDVSHFITKMCELIRSMEEAKEDAKIPGSDAKLLKTLQEENKSLQQENFSLKQTLKITESIAKTLQAKLDQIHELSNTEPNIKFDPVQDDVTILFASDVVDIKAGKRISDLPYYGEKTNISKEKLYQLHKPINNDDIPKGAMKMLEIAATFYPKSISKKLVILHAGISPKSSNVANYISLLKREGMIIAEGNDLKITANGLQSIGQVPPFRKTKDQLIDHWFNFIGSGKIPAKIFKYLADQYPDSKSRDDIITAVGISEKSSSFQSAISDLKGYHLIHVNGKHFTASSELFK